MSAKVENPSPVQEIIEEDDVPTLEAADQEGAPEATAAGQEQSGKQSKRYAKAMAKMGLKPEPNIQKVQIRKNQGLCFAVNNPEVYRFPGTNTFIIFGETQLEDANSDLQEAAARAVSSGLGGASAAAAAPAEVVEEINDDAPATSAPAKTAEAGAAGAAEEDEDAGDLQDKEINVVMAQANVTRGRAIAALKKNNGDIVNAIMDLTM